MNRLFKTDGSTIDILPTNLEEGFTLEECQKMVGGYIEAFVGVPVNHLVICDEGGLMKKLPYNEVASTEAGVDLVGDVMIIERKYFK